MTKNYIFDLGKVLVEYDPLYMTEQYVSDEDDKRLLAEVVFDRIYWDKMDEGLLSHSEAEAQILNRLPERLWQLAKQVFANWYWHIPVIDEVRALVVRLKEEGHPLYLLSNISDYFAENYEKVPALRELLALFDGKVFSAQVKMVKPNPAIFQYLLDKYGLQATECTFVDDNAANVEAAGKMGIQSVLFDGDVKKLEECLFL